MDRQTATVDESIVTFHQLNRIASESRDAEGMARLHTDDCILMPPWDELVSGREAALVFWKNQFSGSENYDLKSCKLTITEQVVSGEWAYEWGVVNGVYHIRDNGHDIFDRSRLFRILKKQPDGNWKIARAIWQNL